MKRSRFFEEQIIGILKEHEAGISVADLHTAPSSGAAPCQRRRASARRSTRPTGQSD